jgi:hypothetical protein
MFFSPLIFAVTGAQHAFFALHPRGPPRAVSK